MLDVELYWCVIYLSVSGPVGPPPSAAALASLQERIQSLKPAPPAGSSVTSSSPPQPGLALPPTRPPDFEVDDEEMALSVDQMEEEVMAGGARMELMGDADVRKYSSQGQGQGQEAKGGLMEDLQALGEAQGKVVRFVAVCKYIEPSPS